LFLGVFFFIDSKIIIAAVKGQIFELAHSPSLPSQQYPYSFANAFNFAIVDAPRKNL
jgi:hypothetical protein